MGLDVEPRVSGRVDLYIQCLRVPWYPHVISKAQAAKMVHCVDIPP